MPRKQPTKAERDHMARVAALGCLICQGPAEVHHVTDGPGMDQRASHYDTIPLCPRHHRTGGPGVALHAGEATWEARFGTQAELLARTRRLLGVAA